MNAPSTSLLLRDIVSLRPFSAVVQAAAVRDLRQIALESPEAEAVNDFTGGYLGVDDRSRAALQIIGRALAGSDSSQSPLGSPLSSPLGGAFFLNGVFGSGKSHLLGVLALLSDGAGHRAFRESHPELAPILGRLLLRKYLVVHLSLDDYAGEQWSLEEIVWREIVLEWKRQNLEDSPVASPDISRREQWAELGARMAEEGRDGMLLCVDELSLFLSSRPSSGLQSDAAFLQFLGQRARQSGEWPLCVVAALQKTVDDIGGLESYSLHQIRDRFTTLQLSLAHIPLLIERRLVRIEDAEGHERIAHSSWERVLVDLPRFEGEEEEWRRLLPFHPPAIALVESIVSRFFSRTRSAALFCAQSLDHFADAPAHARIGLADLFAYIWPEVEAHPDLRPLHEVWESWQRDLGEVAQSESETVLVRRLMQGMLLFKVAGFAPDITQIVHALLFDGGLREKNYELAQVLLERLRTRGGHLSIERRAPGEEGGDRWTIDAGVKTSELARRALRGLIQSLPPGDSRLSRHAVECCRSSLLPLKSAGEVRSQSITWKNAPRAVAWRAWSGAEGEVAWAANWATTLAQAGHEDDWLLLVVPPFGRAQDAREAFDEVLASLGNTELGNTERARRERWRSRVALWMPRAALEDEWARLREATAGALLREDPQLLDNRRGRAVLHQVLGEQEAREAQVERVASRLLREGEIITGDGAAIDASDLALGEGWAQHVEAVAQWALEGVFSRFESVAPRARVLTPSVGDQLCLEILRRPADSPFFAPSLERAVRAVAEPLGGAREREGRWHIAPGREDLVEAFNAALDEIAGASAAAPSTWEQHDAVPPSPLGTSPSTSPSTSGVAATMSALEAWFGKSEWGLRPEQFGVALCLLLRDGRWQALDSRGATLAPTRIGMPLRRAIHALRRGEKIERDLWQRLSEVASALSSFDASAADLAPVMSVAGSDFSAQEKAAAALAQWLESSRLECEGLRARLHQLARQMGHAPDDWRSPLDALSRAEAVFSIQSNRTAAALLQDVARVADEPWLAAWREVARWKSLVESRGSILMQAHAFLSSAELESPPDLAPQKQVLLERLARGEEIMSDQKLLEDCELWREDYSQRYLAWHAAQNASARWLSVERALASEDLRVLARLESLRSAQFSGARRAREALEEEKARRCSHDGRGSAWSACCPACRARWGRRVEMRPLEELLASAEEEVPRLRALRDQPGVRERLERGDSFGRDWISWDGEAASLSGLSSPEHLAALDEALRPRRVAQRSLLDLPQVLGACRTRAECERAFAQWLDGGQSLRGDDEVEWT